PSGRSCSADLTRRRAPVVPSGRACYGLAGMGGERREWGHRELRCIALLLAGVGFAGCKARTAPREPVQVVTTTEPTTHSPAKTSQAEVLAASDLPALLPRPIPDDPMAVTVHRLANGMTVYVSENHEKPQVS